MQMCQPMCQPNEQPAKKDFPKWSEDLQEWFIYHTFALAIQQKGSLAQLVQSVCLTSRGSGVRIPQLPPNESSRLQQCKRLFHEREHSSVGLERLLDKQEVSGSNPLVPTSRKAFRIRFGRLFCRHCGNATQEKDGYLRIRLLLWNRLCYLPVACSRLLPG